MIAKSKTLNNKVPENIMEDSRTYLRTTNILSNKTISGI